MLSQDVMQEFAHIIKINTTLKQSIVFLYISKKQKIKFKHIYHSIIKHKKIEINSINHGKHPCTNNQFISIMFCKEDLINKGIYHFLGLEDSILQRCPLPPIVLINILNVVPIKILARFSFLCRTICKCKRTRISRLLVMLMATDSIYMKCTEQAQP